MRASTLGCRFLDRCGCRLAGSVVVTLRVENKYSNVTVTSVGTGEEDWGVRERASEDAHSECRFVG